MVNRMGSTPDQQRTLAILAPLKAWGGIERKMLTLCREFLAKGIRVEFILTRGGEIPYPDQFPAAVDIVDLRSRHKWDSVLRLQKHLRRSHPDALLTAKDHGAKVAVLARDLFRLDIPVFAKVTNTPSEFLRRPSKRRWARRLYRRADRLIAVSQGVRNDLIQHFAIPPDRVSVIYNPVITADMAERTQRSVDHPWLGTNEERPVIMGLGRLTPQKDFATLLHAFSKVRAHVPARLVIAGEGPERARLESLAAELGIASDVDLPGYVPDPLPWLARARLFVLSSRYEGLANVLVEALAAGTNVLSTDCPSGPREILRDGDVAPLVPIGDADAMVEEMIACLRGDRSTRHAEARLDRFESKAVAEQYLRTMGLWRDE